jgi:hypothetical protein
MDMKERRKPTLYLNNMVEYNAEFKLEMKISIE